MTPEFKSALVSVNALARGASQFLSFHNDAFLVLMLCLLSSTRRDMTSRDCLKKQ